MVILTTVIITVAMESMVDMETMVIINFNKIRYFRYFYNTVCIFIVL